jgi:integrase
VELFTTTRIEKLAVKPGKRDRLFFESGKGSQPGLAIRVTASGGKTYLVQYTRAGKKQRVSLGRVDAISIADARSATRAIMGDLAHGRDPAAERRARKAKAANDELSIAALIERWQTLHLKPTGKRARYIAETKRALHRAFENRLAAPAASLTKIMVVNALDRLTEKGKPSMATQTMAYGRACYRWALGRGTVAANPFVGISAVTASNRERVLDDQEIAALWRATEGPGPFNAIVRMLLLTGQRREEVAAMTWDELSSDGATWTLPGERAKNHRTHIVPLSRQARAIVEAQPRLNDNPFVFAGSKRQNFRGFSNAKDVLLRQTGIEKEFTIHDLRRTVATNLQKLGIHLEVTD